MVMRSLAVGLIIGISAGCALFPSSEPEEPSRPADVEAFARAVRESLQEHEWQTLLSSSNPISYQEQVVRGGKEEPAYLAELLGLNRPGNMIQEGDTLEWSDFDRIALVTLAPVGDQQPPYRYTGQATLEAGELLRLDTYITTVQGRYVLTPPPAP